MPESEDAVASALMWFLVAMNARDFTGAPVAIGPFTEEACKAAKIELSVSPGAQVECRKVVAFRAESFNYGAGGPWVRTVPVFEGDPDFVPSGRVQ